MDSAMNDTTRPRYRGIYPVAPTTFDEHGALDMQSQLRCIDFMIDSGVDGLCILANFSEQFVISDEEREQLTEAILHHVAGRVPVIVTTTHFSSHLCAQRSRRAQELGAAMVMIMPPYHGATIRVTEAGIFDFFRTVSDALEIPIMVQDAPVSGTPLPVSLLARMAREIEQVSYFKIEVAFAATKLRQLIAQGGDAIEGPWDGEEAITLIPDLDAGATGSITGGAYADLVGPILRDHQAGRREAAIKGYERCLPLINYENRQCGLLAAKSLMKEGGIIACEAPRHPLAAMDPAVRAGLIETARRLDPLVLRWGR
jgi:2-keto-3-deoxy-L-arabinonate dehydratase